MLEMTTLATQTTALRFATVIDVRDHDSVTIELDGGAGIVDAAWATTGPLAPPELNPGDRLITVLDPLTGQVSILGALGLPRPSTVRLSGDIVELEAGKELKIRCGEGTVHIDRDGRVTVRGETVSTRARRENKIRGGSVLIN